MKRVTFFMLSTLIIMLAACNNQGEKKETKENKTEAASDFEAFWKNFQKLVANNDKNGVMALCSESMKDFFKTMKYETFMNSRMKDEIATANVSNIEDRGDMGMLFIYKVFHGEENDHTANYSTYGFWFKKVNGKWIINEPQMGG